MAKYPRAKNFTMAVLVLSLAMGIAMPQAQAEEPAASGTKEIQAPSFEKVAAGTAAAVFLIGQLAKSFGGGTWNLVLAPAGKTLKCIAEKGSADLCHKGDSGPSAKLESVQDSRGVKALEELPGDSAPKAPQSSGAASA